MKGYTLFFLHISNKIFEEIYNDMVRKVRIIISLLQ